MAEDYIDDQSKTYAEFDLKKVILAQSQSFALASNNWLVDTRYKKGMYRINKRTTISNYLKVYTNINNAQMLSKLKKDEVIYLKHYALKFSLITPDISRKLNLIINKMLNKYGLTNLSSSGGNEI